MSNERYDVGGCGGAFKKVGTGGIPNMVLENYDTMVENTKGSYNNMKKQAPSSVREGLKQVLGIKEPTKQQKDIEELKLELQAAERRIEMSKKKESVAEVEPIVESVQEQEVITSHMSIYPKHSKIGVPMRGGNFVETGLPLFDRNTLGEFHEYRTTVTFFPTLNKLEESTSKDGGMLCRVSTDQEKMEFAKDFLEKNGVELTEEKVRAVADEIHVVVQKVFVIETLNTGPCDLHVYTPVVGGSNNVYGSKIRISVPRSYELKSSGLEIGRALSQKWQDEKMNEKIAHSLYFTDENCAKFLEDKVKDNGDRSDTQRIFNITSRHPIYKTLKSGLFFQEKDLKKYGMYSGRDNYTVDSMDNYNILRSDCKKAFNSLPCQKHLDFRLQTFGKNDTYTDVVHGNHVCDGDATAIDELIMMEYNRPFKVQTQLLILLKFTVREGILGNSKQ